MARWLEFLASVELDIYYRPGISHQNADSMSKRPCIYNNCKYCDIIEEKWGLKDTGLINRNKGEKCREYYPGGKLRGRWSDKKGLYRLG